MLDLKLLDDIGTSEFVFLTILQLFNLERKDIKNLILSNDTKGTIIPTPFEHVDVYVNKQFDITNEYTIEYGDIYLKGNDKIIQVSYTKEIKLIRKQKIELDMVSLKETWDLINSIVYVNFPYTNVDYGRPYNVLFYQFDNPLDTSIIEQSLKNMITQLKTIHPIIDVSCILFTDTEMFSLYEIKQHTKDVTHIEIIFHLDANTPIRENLEHHIYNLTPYEQ
jgi:hypothetical protein